MALVNRQAEAVRSHPIAYTNDASRVIDYLMERPDFLVSPIIRDGNRVMIGYQEEELLRWIGA